MFYNFYTFNRTL